MEGNINHSAIKNYSEAFASEVANRAFLEKTTLNGEEILQISPVNQVNLFIVEMLFSKWNAESQKLKSPFFNFDAAPVREALHKFMNVLSRHIEVRKEDLQPIIAEAVQKGVLLIFSPYEFYRQEIGRNKTGKLLVNDLRGLKKYVKVNKHLLEGLLQKFEQDGIEAVFVDDAIQIFHQVCENTSESPEDFEPFIGLFSQVSPIHPDMFYTRQDGQGPNASENQPDLEEHNLNEQFKTGSGTLLDSLSKEHHETIADIHRKQPIDGIRQGITINQRFMFINDLFGGNKDEFEMVVNYLDNCTSRDEAMEFIHNNYVQKKDWKLEKEEVSEFFEVVEKKFPQ